MAYRTYAPKSCAGCGHLFTPESSRAIFCAPVCALAARVDRSGGPDACWPWKGTRQAGGYGVQAHLGVLHYAHRLALEKALGRALGDALALHRCDNPPCCNPAHLYEGSDEDNLRDAHERGRRDRVNYATGDRHGSRTHGRDPHRSL